eukprot:tig00021319_g20237.t1
MEATAAEAPAAAASAAQAPPPTSAAACRSQELYANGPLLFGKKEVVSMIKDILKSQIDMDKIKAPTSDKIMSIPETVQRYTRGLCQGNERVGGTGGTVVKAGTKCQVWGNDLKDSADFKVEIDDFRYGKLRKDPEVRPSSTVTADSDNDSPEWQVEKVARTVTVREKSHFKISSGIQAGAQLSVSAGVCNDIACAKAGTSFNPGVDTTKEDTNKKDTETTLHLEKTVNVPPFGHADVVWTIFEREVDIPWEAKATISGNFNMYYWDAPQGRFDQNACAQIIRAFVEQKVVHGEEYRGMPSYLESCGLHIVKIPVCEALIWSKKIRPENAEKDQSKCWYTIDGSYEGVKASDWKSQVQTRPISSKMSWWQAARYHGTGLEDLEPTEESLERMREYVKGKPFGPRADARKTTKQILQEKEARRAARKSEREKHEKTKHLRTKEKWAHRVDHEGQQAEPNAEANLSLSSEQQEVHPYSPAGADGTSGAGTLGSEAAFLGELVEDDAGGAAMSMLAAGDAGIDTPDAVAFAHESHCAVHLC